MVKLRLRLSLARMLFIVATNVIASRPPECQPTGTLVPKVEIQLNWVVGSGFVRLVIEGNDTFLWPNLQELKSSLSSKLGQLVAIRDYWKMIRRKISSCYLSFSHKEITILSETIIILMQISLGYSHKSDKTMTLSWNTSLAALGALAHRLQHCTACNT